MQHSILMWTLSQGYVVRQGTNIPEWALPTLAQTDSVHELWKSLGWLADTKVGDDDEAQISATIWYLERMIDRNRHIIIEINSWSRGLSDIYIDDEDTAGFFAIEGIKLLTQIAQSHALERICEYIKTGPQ